MNDPLKLPNVSIAPKFFDNRNLTPAEIAAMTYEYRITELRDLLWELATNRPSWAFTVTRGQLIINQPHSLRINEVSISEDGVSLGKFSADYYGSSYRLFVANDRIAKQRSGRNGGKMVTADVKRAKREILKSFFKKNPIELAQEACDKAYVAAREGNHTAYSKIRMTTNTFNNNALAFVQRNIEWVITHPEAAPLLEDIAAKEQATKAHKFTETLSEMASSVHTVGYDKAAVVCTLGSTYIVTYKGVTEVIPSEDLAPELRVNMGMLKLLGVGESHEGMGLRATEDVYLIIPIISESENAI